jgi:N6-adenosine-specific RNA methylase IME4
MGRPPIHKTGPMSPTDYQRRWRERVRRRKAAEPKLQKLRAKQERRAERERELATRLRNNNAVLGTKHYGVIYMDPASRFEVRSRVTGLDRNADNHYPTMTWDAIAATAPPAAADCVLLCWTTRAQLMNTLRVIEDCWGFTYKTCQGWPKPRRGTGHIVIDMIIASRGRPVWPAPGTQQLAYVTADQEPGESLFPPVIDAAQGAHSEKPEGFAEQIERLWPNTPKLEMYYHPREDPEQCRAHIEKRKAAGWDLWPPVPGPL